MYEDQEIMGNCEHKDSDLCLWSRDFKRSLPDLMRATLSQLGDIGHGIEIDSELRKLKKMQNGAEYLGHWRRGTEIREGYGMQLGTDGKFYEGHWFNNMANGAGRLVYPDGSFYSGEFVDGNFHGQGKYIWKQDNSTYEG